MRVGVPEPRRDLIERPLERRVGECTDLPAVCTDEMVMVMAIRPGWLEARGPVAEVDPGDKALGGEEVEDAVDARDADATPGCTQPTVQFLG